MAPKLCPLQLFRDGLDTLQIANLTGLKEYEVEKIIHRLRSLEFGKVIRAPRKPRSKKKNRNLIHYAGHDPQERVRF